MDLTEEWIKMLDKLAPHWRSRGLDQRIYEEILIRGEDFTFEKRDEFKSNIEFLGEIMQAHQEYQKIHGAFGDMFGDWLIHHEQTNDRAGQFFTPIQICDFMVALSLPSDEETLKEETSKILDPAAGSGRFMLRTAKYYHKKIGGYNFVFWNIDIDFRVFVYSTMNAILHAIPSFHFHGNSLAHKFWEGFAVMPGSWQHLDEAKATEIMGPPPRKVDEPIVLDAFLGISARSRRVKATMKIIENKKKQPTLETFFPGS